MYRRLDIDRCLTLLGDLLVQSVKLFCLLIIVTNSIYVRGKKVAKWIEMYGGKAAYWRGFTAVV